MRLVLLLFLILMFPVDVIAQQQEKSVISAEKIKEPLLIASPNTCELAKGTFLCEMKAALIWETAQLGNYCVYELDESLPIRCWKNAWSGRFVLSFQSNKTVTYLLKQEEKQTELTRTSINVIGTLEQRMRAKRRSRFFRIF
ncbi:DUF3019 domain-containing protein [Thalassotalea sp. M1531]|uniref:DUF3019 domain-containing protein n=1 Tax=Thalassotalea algicola TaxID=2716224 RepID=A0A7Y0LEX7_9GAMM|nr:DUF3019 domain-containing protein [Thalassotalea algicola]NMP32431.1 DUF3019 domain-containing protein [Thalassotalea algicola]